MWENIGVMLRINDGELARIKSDYADSRDCLREMFRVWLKSVKPQSSWSIIIQALNDLRDDQAFVHKLESKYC